MRGEFLAGGGHLGGAVRSGTDTQTLPRPLRTVRVAGCRRGPEPTGGCSRAAGRAREWLLARFSFPGCVQFPVEVLGFSFTLVRHDLKAFSVS